MLALSMSSLHICKVLCPDLNTQTLQVGAAYNESIFVRLYDFNVLFYCSLPPGGDRGFFVSFFLSCSLCSQQSLFAADERVS